METFVSNEQATAIVTLIKVPNRTYSVFKVSESLKRIKDFAASKNPIASKWPSKTNTIISHLSRVPIKAPEWSFVEELLSEGLLILYNFNMYFVRILAGLAQNRNAIVITMI